MTTLPQPGFPPTQGYPFYPQQHNPSLHPGQSMLPGQFFHGAHNFVVQDPKFIEKYVNNTYNYNFAYPHTGSSVVELLSQRSMPGAELDSYERYPQPRCLEGTRKALIKEIGAWMDQDHDRDMLWLYGPAGVGKSALAQTLGESAEKSRNLGAALFLSESGHGSDLSRLFVAIAHQLARRDPQYSVRVAEQLVADTGLLRKDLATQFRKLIIEPLSGLASLPKKLVVIIDGLDESKGEREQSEILRLIGKTLDSPQPLPLRWMICSRPEPHLQQTILKEFGIRCRWEVVPMDGRDIDLFIRDGFRRIIDTHSQAMESGEIWPREDDIAIIVRAASGLFIYASTIIRFIDDPDLAMPKSQLKVVLDFIQDSSIASSLSRTNPLKPLDTLYLQILSRVHASHLPTLLQLLGACALYPQLPVLELANLLNVTQEGFYAALRRVHSVIHVPSVDKASVDHLRFFHSSFVEFLKNPSRSQSFAFRPRDIHSGYAEACFRALGQTKVLYAKNLSWKARKPSALSLAHRILTYAAHHVWTACTNVGDLGNHPLFDLILDFNFTRLQFVEGKIPALHIRYFVRWLAVQIEKNKKRSIIRWNEVKTPLFRHNETGEKDRCFTIGEGTKAITVSITSDLVILSR